MLPKHLLCKQDAICLLEVVDKSLYCTEDAELRQLMKSLKQLIPHDFAICGLAKLNKEHKIRSYNIFNISYPTQWLELYMKGQYHIIDPIAKEHFSKYQVQYWADTYRRNSPPKDFLFLAEIFGLKNGYTHGCRDPHNNTGSIFSVAGKSVERTRRTEAILEYISPHLHNAITHVLEPKQDKDAFSVSSREREILNWVGQGKSSWDISGILGITERTVNFHVNNVMKKLDAVTRVQAVAVALKRGLIELD